MKPSALAHVLLLWIACAQALAQIAVEDDLGNPIQLSAPAQRILTLSPHAAELVLAAGAGQALVGVAEFAQYPAEIQHLPRVSGYFGADRELILAAKPDLVIAWASGGKPDDVAWLRRIGLPVYLSEPAQLEQIADSIERIGRLAGTEHQAQASADAFRRQLASICPQRDASSRLTAYYEIWPQPAMTMGKRHWLNQALLLVGLRNLFADQDRQIFSLEEEALALRKADVHILSVPPSAPSTASKTVVASPELSRPGPRVIEGIIALCQAVWGK